MQCWLGNLLSQEKTEEEVPDLQLTAASSAAAGPLVGMTRPSELLAPGIEIARFCL